MRCLVSCHLSVQPGHDREAENDAGDDEKGIVFQQKRGSDVRRLVRPKQNHLLEIDQPKVQASRPEHHPLEQNKKQGEDPVKYFS